MRSSDFYLGRVAERIDGIYKGFTVDCEAMGDVGNQIYLAHAQFPEQSSASSSTKTNMSNQFVESARLETSTKGLSLGLTLTPGTTTRFDAATIRFGNNTRSHHSYVVHITRARFFGSFEKTTFDAELRAHRVVAHSSSSSSRLALRPVWRRASSESGARAIETRRRGAEGTVFPRDHVLGGVAADGERRRVRSFIIRSQTPSNGLPQNPSIDCAPGHAGGRRDPRRVVGETGPRDASRQALDREKLAVLLAVRAFGVKRCARAPRSRHRGGANDSANERGVDDAKDVSDGDEDGTVVRA